MNHSYRPRALSENSLKRMTICKPAGIKSSHIFMEIFAKFKFQNLEHSLHKSLLKNQFITQSFTNIKQVYIFLFVVPTSSVFHFLKFPLCIYLEGH